MAVDPALVGFDVANTLQDTLLNYVMSNRRLQQQDRQFNTQMQLERDRFDENRRRYDTAETERLSGLKADRFMLDQELSRLKQKRAVREFDRQRNLYESNPLVRIGLRPDFEEATGNIPRPVLSDRRLPSFYNFIPSYGIDRLFEPTGEDILLNAGLQNLIQKGKE